jgi:hypothetical protein
MAIFYSFSYVYQRVVVDSLGGWCCPSLQVSMSSFDVLAAPGPGNISTGIWGFQWGFMA